MPIMPLIKDIAPEIGAMVLQNLDTLADLTAATEAIPSLSRAFEATRERTTREVIVNFFGEYLHLAVAIINAPQVNNG